MPCSCRRNFSLQAPSMQLACCSCTCCRRKTVTPSTFGKILRTKAAAPRGDLTRYLEEKTTEGCRTGHGERRYFGELFGRVGTMEKLLRADVRGGPSSNIATGNNRNDLRGLKKQLKGSDPESKGPTDFVR